MLRFAPHLAILLLAGPILCGLVATCLPAFGYFPALGGTAFSLEPWQMLYAQPGLSRSVWIALASGLVTSAISLLLVLAFFAAWVGTPFFSRMQQLISPLLSIPHAAAAFGLAFMIAPSGWLARLLSPEITGWTRPPDLLILNDPYGMSMMAGLIVKEIPFLFLVALAALPQTQASAHGRVATSLGYGRMAGFMFVTAPLLYRQIRLAVFAVIAYASSVVDVALILGPTNPAPLAVRLVTWMNDPDLSMRFLASAGALLQLGVSALAIVLWIAGEKLLSMLARWMRCRGTRYSRDTVLRVFTGATMGLAALLVLLGLAALGVWSVAGFWSFPDALPRSFTLRTWSRQLDQIGDPLANTIIIGLIAMLVAVAIALACLERETRVGRDGGNRGLLILYLPLLMPQVAFLFGLQMLFLVSGTSGTLTAVALVHVLFVLPYVFLALADPWRSLDPRYGQISAGLGASANRTFWQVRLPLLLRAVLTAAAIGFAVSIGQYLPTLLIGAGRWSTLTTEAVSLSSGGDRRVIGVYAFLQMVLPFIGFLIAVLVPQFIFRNRRAMRV